jgi:hypothetical protein
LDESAQQQSMMIIPTVAITHNANATNSTTPIGDIISSLTSTQSHTLFALNVCVSAISFACCLAIIILYFYLRRVKCYSLRLVVYLAVSDMLVYLGFFFGGEKSSSSVFCYIQSIILLWFQISSILWVTAMSFSMFFSYVLNLSPTPINAKFYHVTLEKILFGICWGIPLIFLAIGLGLQHNGPTDAFCYISNEYRNWEYLYLYGILWICIVANTIMYIAVVIQRIRRDRRTQTEQQEQRKSTTVSELKQRFKPNFGKKKSLRRQMQESQVEESRRIEEYNRSISSDLVQPIQEQQSSHQAGIVRHEEEEERSLPQVFSIPASLQQQQQQQLTGPDKSPTRRRSQSAATQDDALTALSTEDTLATSTFHDVDVGNNDFNAYAYTENIIEHDDISLYHLRFYLVVLAVIWILPSINRIVNTAMGTEDRFFWLSLFALITARAGGILNLIVYICNYQVTLVEIREKIRNLAYMNPRWSKTGAATIKAAEDAKSTVGSLAKRAMGGRDPREDETEFDLDDESTMTMTSSVNVSSIVHDHRDSIVGPPISPNFVNLTDLDTFNTIDPSEIPSLSIESPRKEPNTPSPLKDSNRRNSSARTPKSPKKN